MLFETYSVVVAYRTAYILLTFLPTVPFGLAGPVYLACLAAVYLVMVRHIDLI
jgi:hypothetical protein